MSDPRSVVRIRPLEPADVDAADLVMRVAFGTFLGAPDPASVFSDVDFVRSRFAAAPEWAFGAVLEGELAGSNFATRWGTYGFFGPLTVRVDLWDRGIASRLLEPVIDLFDRWQVRQAGLFTFAQSPKHVGLYQRFGFWPQYLTAVMERPVPSESAAGDELRFSTLGEAEQRAALDACRELTGAIFEGLDVEHEIRSTQAQRLGDTVLVHEGSRLVGLAVCHCGAGEAGSGAYYVKFGAAAPGPKAGAHFERLLDACERLASERGLQRMVAGMNLARQEAYLRMRARGYRSSFQGVIMQRPNEPGYCRPEVHVIDDLR